MEIDNNIEIVASSSLHQVTSLSKYLAMVLFVIMPFLGGWIGYTYAPVKLVEVEILNNTTSNNPLYKDTAEKFNITNAKNEFELQLSPYHVEYQNSDSESEWINIYSDESELNYSIIGEKVFGGICYLGLCNTPSEEEFETEQNVVWKKINITDCVGGCSAIKSFYRVTKDEKNYYFIIWENASETEGLSLLKTFAWK